MSRLNKKVVLVTGAAQGIGRAIAELFVAEGATTILSDCDDNSGQLTVKEVGSVSSGESKERNESNVEYIHLDVSLESDWQAAAKYIEEKHGVLDVLVNNAGITGFLEASGPHDPENLDMESWHKVHDVNLHGTVLGCKYGIQMMKESEGGSIVNISSRSGIIGISGAVAYASSKAAVRNHTKSVALYCAEKSYPIRCNSIHPAAIMTPMWDAMLGTGEQRESVIEGIAADIPLGKMGEPEDVAYGALYLASDESKYVTGIELNIDGGILAGAAASPKRA